MKARIDRPSPGDDLGLAHPFGTDKLGIINIPYVAMKRAQQIAGGNLGNLQRFTAFPFPRRNIIGLNLVLNAEPTLYTEPVMAAGSESCEGKRNTTSSRSGMKAVRSKTSSCSLSNVLLWPTLITV